MTEPSLDKFEKVVVRNLVLIDSSLVSKNRHTDFETYQIPTMMASDKEI